MEKFKLKECKKCQAIFKIFRKDKEYCEVCRCIKICPKCKTEIRLANEYNVKLCHDRVCNKCSLETINANQHGENNPFYGKKHSEETKLKLSSYERTDTQKLSAKQTLTKNRNKRPIYEIWLEKYGKTTADIKFQEWKQKTKNCGSKNGMYGKPSPVGSGNGWSGWYEGIYFRSILELTYLKNLLDNGITFESGELKKHLVEYILESGESKHYFFDFYLIDTQEAIEIKPSSLTYSKTNTVKFDAARKRFGDKFKIVTELDITKLSDVDIKTLYENGKIKWIQRYERKYTERYASPNPDTL